MATKLTYTGVEVQELLDKIEKGDFDNAKTLEWHSASFFAEASKFNALSEAFATEQGYIDTLQSYFNNGMAKDSEKLGGQVPACYATASSLNTLSQTVADFKELFDSLFEKDDANNAIKAKLSLYSLGGITAGGVGSSGGSSGGGTSYNRLDSWEDYSADKSGWVLSALLGKDLDDRVSTLANAGYITASALAPYALRAELPSLEGYATEAWVASQGYLTGITSAMVVNALGYTPFNVANFTKGNIKSTLGISDWALASVKPAYEYSEIGNTPDLSVYAKTTAIPTKLSQLTDDVVSGKYLPLTGGTVNGVLSVNSTLKFSDVSGKYKTILQRDSNDNVLFGGSFSSHNMYIDCDVLRVRAHNSIFSNNITSPTFTGDLAGNASNALKLGGYSPSSYAMYSHESKVDANEIADGFYGGKLLGAPSSWYYPYYAFISVGYNYYKMQFNGYSNRLWYRSGDANGLSNKAWREVAFTDSNVASATKLATARKIWGNKFDGTEDIIGGIAFNSSLKISWFGDANNYYIGGVADSAGGYLEYKAYSGHSFLGGNVAIGGAIGTEKLRVYGTAKITDTLTAPSADISALNTQSLTIGGVTLTAQDDALWVNGNLVATGGITAGGAGAQAISSIESRLTKIEQQLGIA